MMRSHFSAVVAALVLMVGSATVRNVSMTLRQLRNEFSVAG